MNTTTRTPAPERAKDCSEIEECARFKIWKYMDLAKFLSLLTTKSLYFASPARFQDLSEGSLPKSHVEAVSNLMQEQTVEPMVALRPHFAAKSPEALAQFDGLLRKMATGLRTASREATLRFGVSCWHLSEYESEAMWKLYSASGQAIAIESTVGQLRSSFGKTEHIVIDRVRYADFDQDGIEKGHRHYGLFMKRRSFEHEKELRATILLPEEQWQLPENERGLLVGCDLDVLINRVHVSPLCELFVASAVDRLCRGKACPLDKPVLQSQLLLRPRI